MLQVHRFSDISGTFRAMHKCSEYGMPGWEEQDGFY
jgi:hypothetical protein